MLFMKQVHQHGGTDCLWRELQRECNQYIVLFLMHMHLTEDQKKKKKMCRYSMMWWLITHFALECSGMLWNAA